MPDLANYPGRCEHGAPVDRVVPAAGGWLVPFATSCPQCDGAAGIPWRSEPEEQAPMPSAKAGHDEMASTRGIRMVVLESPYGGADTRENAERYADQALLDSLSRGESPIASHLLLTRVLDDQDESQRAHGIACGITWIRRADALVVYRDLGVTRGMRRGIALAEFLGVAVEYREIEGAE